MSGCADRILFAPASGPGGSGEYYRCLVLARTIADETPGIEIEFLLHAEARVERDERFVYHPLSATPARAGEEVIRLMEQRRPALVVFDCTGRVAQFRAAQRLGARVAWISNRPRKRLKGFRPRQMRWMDLHVIIDSFSPQPRLHRHERLLLGFFRGVDVELVRGVVPRPDDAALAPWLPELPDEREFAVFVAGGGGYEHAGRPIPEIFLEAARRFRRETRMPTVVVMGPQYRGEVDADPEVSVLASLPTAALGALLARSKLAVIGAGNMLSGQALAAGVPLVVSAVGGRDQPRRVARLEQAGRAKAAQLDPALLCEAATAVLREQEQSPARSAPAASRNDAEQVARRLLQLIS
ncbi:MULTISPECIES: glycosyltransferase [unclassified Wenzhouxiangella]|uniref:glycosyltransferase n=1 Tax=unclassified Wenzhouxiangella TaxID=2613841 RepID=UPI000E329B28|nr:MULTISPECIES: hypothetical protein [unclassified Wenzhouxiangella]RFF28542.1 hypothetical protein DZK25_03130 [Wenzhouxiangella sp. 15181]RFP70061.1 hypothetical protein DZK26_02230 [Wenzhouxiangella sp. 15190]